MTAYAQRGQRHPDPRVSAVAFAYAKWLLDREPKTPIAKLVDTVFMAVRFVGVPRERYDWARLVTRAGAGGPTA